ncbi:MAG: ABC transporter ATP-binding protein [Chloroflexi bacterium]|nr:ABC transporter ATP-binding protein [Chloroflexota bacterium]
MNKTHEPAIRCRGLTKRFGPVTALHGLDLEVPQGSIAGFLGPNGAGKTTALRILAGLSRATSGQAWVAGQPVALNSPALQQNIGYLPDTPAFYGWMTGRQYLAFVAELFRLDKREAGRRCDELLDLVGLTADARRRIGGYSRGMRQRLGVAQALVNRPRVLLMDEPTSALDPVGRLEVMAILGRLRDQRTTVFLSTHLLDDAQRLCDDIAIIHRGRLLAYASTSDLRQRYAAPIFELEFEEDATAFAAVCRTAAWVESAQVDLQRPGLVHVHAPDDPAARGALLTAAAGSGLTLRRYEQVLPTLEEVFVKLVGQEAL